jgi:CheY-like chemotaxis protein
MIMPDLSGKQVMDQLKKIEPAIKVILSSGYSLNGLGENGLDAPGDGFIQKPYRIEQLAAAINEVIYAGEK